MWFQKLLLIGILFFVTLVLLSVLGERPLPLFHGDRDLAGRAMKAIFAGLGGLGFAFAQPAIRRGFAGLARDLIGRGGDQGFIARRALSPGFQEVVVTFSLGLMAVFALASLGLSRAIWTGRV